METVVLTQKTGRVLEILKANGGPMAAADIAALDPAIFEKGASSVTPILTNLVRKDFVAKNAEKVQRSAIDKKTGSEVVRDYTSYQIADLGAELVYEVK